MIQSVLFDKSSYTVPTAKQWLKKHKMIYSKVDETPKKLRFRQHDPKKGARYATKKYGDISFVVDFVKGGALPLQALLGGALPLQALLGGALLGDDSYSLTNELSNYDIDAWMEHFAIKNYHGCYVKDDLPPLNPGFYVINLNGQSHWTALLKTVDDRGDSEFLYYDSYGFPAPIEVENAIEKDSFKRAKAKSAKDIARPSYVSMENQIQDLDATSCGFYVIAWVRFLYRKKDKIKAYQDFIEKFKEDTDYNDAILQKLLR
jgi:hypothetical protein